MRENQVAGDIVHGVPPIAVSTGSTLANRTGSWKYVRPIYQDMVAPCNAACPVGTDIEGYMNLLREGKVAEARDLLLRENPMPAVTGRVCDHPCQTACNRAFFDDAVNIHAVERMLGDLEPEVNLFESDREPGGALRHGIPEYRLPRNVLVREIERIRSQGVNLQCGVRVGGNLSWKELESHDAIFLASGARVNRPLELAGQDAADVRPGLEFLRNAKAGDRGAVGQRVVVVGGTDTAVDCARTALRLGADAVVICQGSRAELSANAEAIDEAIREGVRFEFRVWPVAVQTSDHPENEAAIEAIRSMYAEGEDDRPKARLVGVECVRMQTAQPDPSGARRALPIQGSNFILPADTLLTALGEEPDFGFLPPEITRKS
jgi:NADPH-dependent glutamate synthase beta subunit-like oxidoreductase